jgi:hypothetical protein
MPRVRSRDVPPDVGRGMPSLPSLLHSGVVFLSGEMALPVGGRHPLGEGDGILLRGTAYHRFRSRFPVCPSVFVFVSFRFVSFDPAPPGTEWSLWLYPPLLKPTHEVPASPTGLVEKIARRWY